MGLVTGDRAGDVQRDRLRERLETLRARAEKSTSWRTATSISGGW